MLYLINGVLAELGSHIEEVTRSRQRSSRDIMATAEWAREILDLDSPLESLLLISLLVRRVPLLEVLVSLLEVLVSLLEVLAEMLRVSHAP